MRFSPLRRQRDLGKHFPALFIHCSCRNFPEEWLMVLVFFVSDRVAWHSFGRKPCARRRRSFCFQWHHRNNFVL